MNKTLLAFVLLGTAGVGGLIAYKALNPQNAKVRDNSRDAVPSKALEPVTDKSGVAVAGKDTANTITKGQLLTQLRANVKLLESDFDDSKAKLRAIEDSTAGVCKSFAEEDNFLGISVGEDPQQRSECTSYVQGRELGGSVGDTKIRNSKYLNQLQQLRADYPAVKQNFDRANAALTSARERVFKLQNEIGAY